MKPWSVLSPCLLISLLEKLMAFVWECSDLGLASELQYLPRSVVCFPTGCLRSVAEAPPFAPSLILSEYYIREGGPFEGQQGLITLTGTLSSVRSSPTCSDE